MYFSALFVWGLCHMAFHGYYVVWLCGLPGRPGYPAAIRKPPPETAPGAEDFHFALLARLTASASGWIGFSKSRRNIVP